MFYEQLLKCCNQNGLKLTPLLKELKINASNATGWKNGAMPNSESVIKLSERLNVSTDYLLTGKEPQVNTCIYPQKIQNIIDNLLKFDSEDIIYILGETNGMLRNEKYIKKSNKTKTNTDAQ